MAIKEIVLPILYIALGVGLPMVRDLIGVSLVGISLLGLWWVHLPAVLKERNVDAARTQTWLWRGWGVIFVLCLLWGWAIYPSSQIRPYTIGKEDEVDFLQALRTAGHNDADIEIAHVPGDAKATKLAQQISALLELRGWDAQEWRIPVPKDPAPGVTIWAGKDAEAAGVLKTLLTKYDIETRVLRPAPGEELLSWDSLRILIGPDPQDLPRR